MSQFELDSRASADRTCLQANSPPTGNFTGKFAILGSPTQFRDQRPLRPSRSGNREFSRDNREFARHFTQRHPLRVRSSPNTLRRGLQRAFVEMSASRTRFGRSFSSSSPMPSSRTRHGAVTADQQRRRAMATPNRNATNSEPRGASRAILLKMLNGIPGLRPASIAPLTRLTVPFTASETSAMADLGSGAGSKPS